MASVPYAGKRHINDNYDVVGFISSGTYGRVYKAKSKGRNALPVVNQTTGRNIEAFAIKKCGQVGLVAARIQADLKQIQTRQGRRAELHRYLTICHKRNGTLYRTVPRQRYLLG